MKPYILLFLALLPPAAAVEINEIMYNPAGADRGYEWVELFNPDKLNLSNWTIGDLMSNDTLVAVKITNSSFAIIVENESLFNDSNASLYYAGPLIGNGLGNSGDTIHLYSSNGSVIDSVNYNNSFANGNNKTLEKHNNSWSESLNEGGTPGFNNSFHPLVNLTNSTFENETETNETGNTTINDTQGNQTNQTNVTNENTCIAEISINTTKEIYVEEKIKFKHIINSSEDFSIIYWIEDLFGNVVKDEYETETLTYKSYTPHPEEDDRVFVIKSVLKGCKETYAERIIIYRKQEETRLSAEENEEETKEEEEKETAHEAKQQFSYSLLSYSEQIPRNSEASAVVEIISDNEPHLIKLTAYLYRGPKKYSGIAEHNFTLGKMESEAVELKFFTNASAGDYKLKVKINKDNQKTDYQLRANVTVVEDKNGSEKEPEAKKEKKTTKADEKPSSREVVNITNPPVVYKSAKAKSEALVPIILISLLALVSAVLIWKR